MITFEIKAGENIQKIKSQLLTALKIQGIETWAIFHPEPYRSISIAVSANNERQSMRDSRILQSFGNAVSQPQVNEDLSLITLVGQDIYLSSHVQPSVSDVLKNAGVNIKQIGNGTSPDAIVFAVEHPQARRAMQLIHDRIVLNGGSTTVQLEPALRHQPAL